MIVGERGQVTIPKDIRERFGIGPKSEVEFHEIEGELVLRKKGPAPDFEKWVGFCAGALRDLNVKSGDELIELMRGR